MVMAKAPLRATIRMLIFSFIYIAALNILYSIDSIPNDKKIIINAVVQLFLVIFTIIYYIDFINDKYQTWGYGPDSGQVSKRVTAMI